MSIHSKEVEEKSYKDRISDLLDSSEYLLSNIKPSEWAEQHRFMTSEVSPFPGRFSFNHTPYLREILDCMSPDNSAHTIVCMKAAQVGYSTGVIENAIGYIIDQCPGNILFLTGHGDLAEEAMSGKIDNMIDSCGLRPMIRPNSLRKKNQRTGDTNKSKEFPGGSLVAGSATNHKLLRQRSVKYGFIDDYEAAPKYSKESGSTFDMIQKRFSAYSKKKKVFYISTPEVKQTSNIEPLYLMGDQRKYFVPCPCCGDFITLEWYVEVDGIACGIRYELDSKGDLVEDSVGYVCQSCKDFFKENHKYEMNLSGEWRPTAKASELGFVSFHLNSLYAPAGMDDWTDYVHQYLKASPNDGNVDIRKMQTFTNLVLGETYEQAGEVLKANQLQKNVRNYEIGVLPEKMSENDGNGKIVLLTCGSDLNGTLDDARLDYEILAWSESGANYSIKHGSIGTFIPNQTREQKDKTERQYWTYREYEPFNVWDEFAKIIEDVYVTDTGRKMKILMTGVDTGHLKDYAYSFIDKMKGRGMVVGIKGKDTEKYRRFNTDTQTFRVGKERGDLYLVEVNQIKDDLAEMMKLRWKNVSDAPQPSGFMNFPEPSGGLYGWNNFFSHFEAEHRVIDKEGEGGSFRWVKKNSAVQNHLFDCRVYNIALKDIIIFMICRELKIKNYGWKDFVDLILQKK